MGISLGLALLVLAAACAIWAFSIRRRTGLPWVPVRSQDVLGRELEKPLFSRRLGLTGKPDYVLEIRGELIPVEVKPSRIASTPYDSDLMQLASYCLLIEETEGEPPPYGLLRYAERTFRLDYTDQLREDVLALIDEMRDLMDEPDCARSHDEPPRCRSCGFYTICDDALEA